MVTSGFHLRTQKLEPPFTAVIMNGLQTEKLEPFVQGSSVQYNLVEWALNKTAP